RQATTAVSVMYCYQRQCVPPHGTGRCFLDSHANPVELAICPLLWFLQKHGPKVHLNHYVSLSLDTPVQTRLFALSMSTTAHQLKNHQFLAACLGHAPLV